MNKDEYWKPFRFKEEKREEEEEGLKKNVMFILH